MNRQHIKLTFFILLGFVAHLSVWAQEEAPNQEFTPPQVFLPKTPAAEGLYKFSPFPVDHTSGAVNTDIPIYTIKSGRIRVPISISYQSSGIKVQDIASMIGLGWNLNFGYNISVTEEEHKIYPYSYKMYKSETAALAATDLGVDWVNEMTRSADGYYPSMHPVYSFRCGQFSGAFFYDDDGQLQLLSENDNFKIEPIKYSSTVSTISGFKITTNDGIEYVFDQKETASRQTQTYPGPTEQTTAFWVSGITDLISGETVTFFYKEKLPYTSYQNETYSRIYQLNFPNPAVTFCRWDSSPPEYSHSSTPFKIESLQIESIGFNGGYIQFRSETDRLDIDKTRITGMGIYTTVGPPLLRKEVDFDQSYFVSSGNGADAMYNYRLKLDAVTIKSRPGSVDTRSYTHRFGYNTLNLPPYRGTVFGSSPRNDLRIDYWGFYNGSTGGTGLIPEDINSEYLSTYGINDPSPRSTDRKANPQYTQACILNKVTYPTGGYAVFEYQNHQLPGYYLGNTLGGVRIKNIKYFSRSGDPNPIQKTFNYLSVKELTPASIWMYGYRKDKNHVNNEYNYPNYCFTLYQMLYLSSDPLYQIVYHRGSPVFYDKVEVIEGTEQANAGKVVYTYRFSNSDHNVYALSSFKENGSRKFIHNSDWKRGQLVSKEVYKSNNDENNPFTIISKEVNSYTGFGDGRIRLGFGVSKNDNSSSTLEPPFSNSFDLVGPEASTIYLSLSNSGDMPMDAFLYNDWYTYRSYPRLSKQEKYLYEEAETIYTAKDYYYESAFHEQITRVEMTDSEGRVHKTEYKYVQDEQSISDVNFLESDYAFPKLVQYNKLNDVIEQNEYIDGQLIQRRRVRFNSEFNYRLDRLIPLVQSVETINYDHVDGVQGKRIAKFLDYNDHTRLLQQQDIDGIVHSYLWDDKSIEPIAHVTNASYDDVYQTSFEHGAKGKWTYTAESSYDSSPPSGSRSYILSSGNSISATGLSTDKTYIVSYWSKNGSYTVTGSINVKSGPSQGSWTYYEHVVSGNSTVWLSGSGAIDELRLYPKGAQMTTYTYNFLGGMNSLTDANNITSHYEYDGLGRLKNILDQERSILKSYEYNYKVTQ